MHDIAAFKFVTVVSSTVIGWVWQFTLQSAQRHNQISKIGDIFEKISKVPPTPPFSNYQVHEQSKKEATMLSLVQLCSELIMVVTSLQLFLWWKGGVGRSGTPLAHVPEPTSTILI